MTAAAELIPGWNAAKSRVLNRLAADAEVAATLQRERAPHFPDWADDITADADRLNLYAAECRAAAADPSLPTPEYLPEENR